MPYVFQRLSVQSGSVADALLLQTVRQAPEIQSSTAPQ